MRKITAVVLGLLVCLPLAVDARSAGKVSLSGFGGIGLPMNPTFFKDYFKMGVGFGGEIRFHLSEMTALAGSFTRQPFKLNADKFSDLFAEETELGEARISGGNIICNVISANVIRYFSPSESPSSLYLTLGGGYYLLPAGEVTVQVGMFKYTEKFKLDEKKFGLNGGVGLEAEMNPNMNLFVEGKFHFIFTDDAEDDAGADFSGKTSFVTVMAGLRMML